MVVAGPVDVFQFQRFVFVDGTPKLVSRLIAELRAKSGDRLLRLIAVRSFLALTSRKNYPPPS
ncbi:MAG TPA: hypothetical protein VN857_09270 [Chthoniobacterales bacterium]|jgi:hypothetical protein|nr:hypothetical protein [Chthoniobacterales bacterium]